MLVKEELSMYEYKKEKPQIFTESGQVMFLKVRDQVNQHLKQSGAVRLQEATSGIGGDSWTLLACVDRLVELGEIAEITQENTAGQHRVFIDRRF